MKKFIIFFLLIFFLPTLCLAAPEIKYDKQRFDLFTGTYYLTGNVSVKTDDRLITADYAEVGLYSLTVFAKGHIRLLQDDITFTGDTVKVIGKDKTAFITGNLNFIQDDLDITSDEGSFNWSTKDAVFVGNVKIKEQNTIRKTTKTTYNVISHTFQDDSQNS